MDFQLIECIVRLMEASSLSVLEVEAGGNRVRVEKPAGVAPLANPKASAVGMIGPADLRVTAQSPAPVLPASAPAFAEPTAAPPASPTAPTTAPETPAPEAANRKGSKELKSPMVGTFHFLKGKEDLIGQRFKRGDAVCTIEAMKLMNEIVMEEDGEIGWVAVAQGDMVEYGQLILTFE